MSLKDVLQDHGLEGIATRFPNLNGKSFSTKIIQLFNRLYKLKEQKLHTVLKLAKKRQLQGQRDLYFKFASFILSLIIVLEK